MNYIYLKGLTKTQIEIVNAPHGPVRIIAGPGSGKTRALTYRIAHLVFQGLDPNRIVALTFTNLAAKEMRERVEGLIGKNYRMPWISTYHSFCMQFLKNWGEIEYVTQELKFTRAFDIIDRNAQKTLLKRIYTENKITFSDIPYKVALNYIAIKKKFEMFSGRFIFQETTIEKKIYSEYVSHQQHMNLLDFDDLIIITRKVLEENKDVRIRWQNRIVYLLVDEFQDTSTDQVQIVKYLVNPNFNNIFVVGDPFQTIYSWRGAKSEYLTSNFLLSFPKTKTYSLVENFRSTKKIVKAANLIRNTIIDTFNDEKHKELVSMLNHKGDILFRRLKDKAEQAKFVVDTIKSLYKNNEQLQDIAILYRTNRESAEFEKWLRLSAIPYKIHGAFAFFDRTEVQDAIAYLSLINKSASDIHFERIIASPKKGIGGATIEKLYNIARKHNKTLENILFNNQSYLKLTRPTIKKLEVLQKALEKACHELKIKSSSIGSIFRVFLKEIGYFGIFEGKLDLDERKENVEELISDMEFAFKDNTMTLAKYLDKLKLLEGREDLKDNRFISMMTFHKAKGKEYKHVFIVSLMDGHFPSKRTLFDESLNALQEEWRLFYVAITRAKEYLYLTCYDSDFSSYEVSRFLLPLSPLLNPKTHSESKKLLNNSQLLIKSKQDFIKGDIVEHSVFGKGRVLSQKNDKVLVDFFNYGKIEMQINNKMWLAK